MIADWEIEEERIAAEIARANQEREALEMDADYDAFGPIRKGYKILDELCRVGHNDLVEALRTTPGRAPMWFALKLHAKRFPRKAPWRVVFNYVREFTQENAHGLL